MDHFRKFPGFFSAKIARSFLHARGSKGEGVVIPTREQQMGIPKSPWPSQVTV